MKVQIFQLSQMKLKEFVQYNKESCVRWHLHTNESLIRFCIHTSDYISYFNFAGADGLDNFKSNLHVLLKECKSELEKRGIKL